MPPLPIASPTLLLDGAEVARNEDLAYLSVTQTIGAAAHASLRFDRAELAVAKYKVGSKLIVKAPDAQANKVVLFSGAIVSVGLDWRADRTELIVDAYDDSHKLAQKTVIKNYLKEKPATIIASIAREAGLTSDVSGAGLNVVYPYIQQYGTPHQFLTELVHTAGCEWWMDESKIVVRERTAAGGSAVTLGGDKTLRRFSARFSALDRATKVNVRGWDPATKKEVVGTATGVNNGAPSTPSIATKGTAASGEATSWPRRVVGKDDANAIAKGIAGRMGASLLSARGEADVSPKIRPGVVVTIEQVSQEWNGNYYITEAEHSFGRDRPFMTRFVAGGSDDESIGGLLGRQGAHNGARFTDGLTVGIVTNNKDDEKMNRVKVKFPYLTDSGESGWARLVSPGAGKSRGLMILPEIDDEVLVGFENGDVRRPYVLGGLWNGKDAPPMDAATVVGGNKVVTRSLTTRLGHHLSFVDKDGPEDTITLALKGDKATLVLGGDKITLVHADDVPLTVKTSTASIEIAKGGDITMKGKNITIEAQATVTLKGTDVKIDAKAGIDAKANAKVSVKGTGGVDVDGSPGLTNVKGSMVMIN